MQQANPSEFQLNFAAIPQVKGKKGCHIKKDMREQVIIITGSSAGIGKETARILAFMGATIIFACRDQSKTLPIIQAIQQETKNNNLEFMKLDLGHLESITEFVKEFKAKHQKLNILINNAGANTPDRRVTKDGFELTFGTNHLGHFYLTNLLLDILEKSAPSRIINVASSFHKGGKMKWGDLMYEKKYDYLAAYNQSKLANILFTKELQKRVSESKIKVVSLHPGIIKTEFARDFQGIWYFKLINPIFRLIQKNTLEGSQTSLYCALEEFANLKAGAYYLDCKVHLEARLGRKEEDWKRLWEVSEKLIAEKTRI